MKALSLKDIIVQAPFTITALPPARVSVAEVGLELGDPAQ